MWQHYHNTDINMPQMADNINKNLRKLLKLEADM